MNEAPTFDELEKDVNANLKAEQTPVAKDVNPPSVPSPVLEDEPTVSVIYCGGCGLNMYRLTKDKIKDAIPYLLDTSTSNLEGDMKYAASLVDGCYGSGNVQATNLESIKNYINQKVFANKKPADINIVIFSLSGGSGSVMGPLVIRELKRQNVAMMAMAVADYSSQRSIENTANSVQTLMNICEQDNIYLPIALFDNTKSQSNVDKVLTHRLNLLLSFFRERIARLDKTDKIFWIRPDITTKAKPGMYSFHISLGKDGDYDPDSGELLETNDQTVYDSVMFISPDTNDTFKYRSINLYKGVSSGIKMYGLVGFDLPSSFITGLNDQLNAYQTQAKKKKEIIINNRNRPKEEDDGLVFG